MQDATQIPLHRKHLIRARLEGGSPVTSVDLAVEFGVSEDAIRRDLRALAAEGLCQRVYGGALPISKASGRMEERVQIGHSEKLALAEAALPLIRPGQTLFLDSSSTNLALAQILPVGGSWRIVTNSIAIAGALLARRDVETSMVGGQINAETGGCVDAKAIADLQHYSIDLCMLGACAFSVETGLAGFQPDDVQFKRALIGAASHCAVMLTAEKIETSAPYRICRTKDIAAYVFPSEIAPGLERQLTDQGAQVLHAFPS